MSISEERYAALTPEDKRFLDETGANASAETFLDWSTFWERDHDEAEWLYPDVLARARSHSVYAARKDMKSLLSLFISGQLATGPEPVVVLYLDYEMCPDDVRDRLEDMGYGPESDLSRLKYDLLPTLPPLDTREGGQALLYNVDQLAADFPGHHLLVVTDTTSRAVLGPEDKSDTIRALWSYTGIELKRRGCTWLRNDHAGKDLEKGQRGTSAKGDDVDIVWQLTKTSEGVRLKRDVARMNWVPERVSLGLLEDPLRFVRQAGDTPEGAGEVANLLDRLAIPLGASRRDASAAIKKQEGKSRRHEVVAAALRIRVERLAERFEKESK